MVADFTGAFVRFLPTAKSRTKPNVPAGLFDFTNNFLYNYINKTK
jgi:hypothetical protein